jgi:predicted dehydrogenase
MPTFKPQPGPVKAVLAGAGSRGRDAYGRYALSHPGRLQFVAVAEPVPERRALFQRLHNIPDERAFESWDQLLASAVGRLADACVVATPDQLHYAPAMAALDLGYHLLLEKPIAPSLAQCREIAAKALERDLFVQICHVLRFTDFWRSVKGVVASGVLGKIIHYDHSENVAYWHYGHSYVRGNWKNAASSSPVIVAKTCHDLDLMAWFMGERAQGVQSIGDLTWFKPENAPPDAPDRCTDGCPHAATCPWYAPRLYMSGEEIVRLGAKAPTRGIRAGAWLALKHPGVIRFLSHFIRPLRTLVNWDEWPATTISTDLSPAGKQRALEQGPYGVCAYKAGNDVCDHQVSTFVYPGGVTATLMMHGFAAMEGRRVRILGTQGELNAEFLYNGERVVVSRFGGTRDEVVHERGMSVSPEGHGGGDTGLGNIFTAVLLGEGDPAALGATDVMSAIESHVMAFAAEEARKKKQFLDLAAFRA